MVKGKMIGAIGDIEMTGDIGMVGKSEVIGGACSREYLQRDTHQIV